MSGQVSQRRQPGQQYSAAQTDENHGGVGGEKQLSQAHETDDEQAERQAGNREIGGDDDGVLSLFLRSALKVIDQQIRRCEVALVRTSGLLCVRVGCRVLGLVLGGRSCRPYCCTF